MTEDAREEHLRDRQDGRVYPVGRALRATFDAENHDTLGTDVTGLMIDLSKVPYGEEIGPVAPSSPTPAAMAPRGVRARAVDATARPGVLARIGLLFGMRPTGRT